MSARTIHVLQVINTARVGGGMGHLYALVRALDPPEFKATIVATDEGSLTHKLRDEGFNFVDLNMMRSRLNPKAILALADLIERLDVDIVHLHGTRAGWFGALAGLLKRRRKTIYTIHGFSFNKDMSSPGKMFYTQIERLLARMHDQLISVCDKDREEAVQKGICCEEKILTIHNGIDIHRFDPALLNGQGMLMRRSWEIGGQSPVVGTVARLVPQKGIEEFINAADLVRRKRPDVRFVVVGEGELRPRLEAHARRLGLDNGVLRFVGPSDEVPNALSALDVFVLSSLWEGHPISLLEALAMELPSVATETSGTPEILKHRETGLLVPPKDPPALADAILYMLDNPRQAAQMGARGRREVVERFAESRMVDNTLDIYRRLAAESS